LDLGYLGKGFLQFITGTGTAQVLLKWKTAGNNVAPLVVVSTHLAKDWKTGWKKMT
jgi:hypothetical protein